MICGQKVKVPTSLVFPDQVGEIISLDKKFCTVRYQHNRTAKFTLSLNTFQIQEETNGQD